MENLFLQLPNEEEWQVGVGKKEITCLIPNLGMLGWATYGNVCLEVESPLFARAFVFYTPISQKKCAWVNAEICFISLSIFLEVTKILKEQYPQLGLDENNIMLTANHTHSCAGGYTHSVIYNLTIPGYEPEVFRTYVRGIVEAILEAHQNLQPARLSWGVASFAPEVPIAFNRSVQAYNQNPEVEPLPWEKRHLAVDRNMYLLSIETPEGKPIGSINWFSLHTTSIHSDKHTISSDNKGYAATDLENYIQNKFQLSVPYIAAFAQSTSGDVTPNYILHPGQKETRGPTPDDYENKNLVGLLQSNKAKEILYASRAPIPPCIDTISLYFDLSNVAIDPEFCSGLSNQRTGPATFGTTMLLGTAEGGGISPIAWWIIHQYALFKGLYEPTIYGNKVNFLESVEHKLLGSKDLSILRYIPEALIPGISKIWKLYAEGGLGDQPLSPQIVPIQIFILGKIAIVALPAEPTTIAGKRIRQTVAPILAKRGVEHVIIGGYANAYTGYITTLEEYQCQLYEGSHTVFGKWTCAAYQTLLKKMAEDLLKPASLRKKNNIFPHYFSEEELEPQYYKKLVIRAEKIMHGRSSKL
ncbi:MAG: neutral/alkaline non-lysosomal ceramidase N-terminal domain-containing protein [Bacteroidia bacterium]|nr:neutral/alkaline non-lysosomal ceramidase N-terminal domain-containing protein [Bacteroidia bacterium]MDW8158421.1 neutral/alkaline non-lysosomal ceramidase N-terminal domain-containing protein [Bacteroidia bacterium]